MSTILNIARKLGLNSEEISPFGINKAKIRFDKLKEYPLKGKLVLVTAMSPTPSGEGKTTISIGLSDALSKLKQSTALALREPSMGPCFGFKGGATGGGKASVIPEQEINLHFTGDFHAISAANNLLSALIENHIHRHLQPELDPTTISWRRVLDLNDRSLREIVTGLGNGNGFVRQSGFDITPASEIMAIFCLARDHQDLFNRLGKIQVGLSKDKQPISAKDINAPEMLSIILKDALYPNLVQTLEGTPALIHGGPFANIAHGCNSIVATETALKLADIVVTEAGFGSDLGAEKFIDIKCRQTGLQPSAIVIVATIKALKYHGGVSLKKLSETSPQAVQAGLPNLKRHCQNILSLGLTPIITLNHFTGDQEEEIQVVKDFCQYHSFHFTLSKVFEQGGEGGIELAKKVLEMMNTPSKITAFYPLDISLKDKVKVIAQKVYGADDVIFEKLASHKIKRFEIQGHSSLPVCIAKVPGSFTDNPNKLGAPEGFSITITDARLSAGAGFVVMYAGSVLTMPGLPKHPQAQFSSQE